MITGFVKMGTIVSSLYRNLGINSEINEADVTEWCSEGLNMIGAYGQYEEVSHCLNITNGKAKLPCGLHKLVDIRYKGLPIYWATNTNASNYQCHDCRIPVCNTINDYTFYINNSYIITNINDENCEEANLCMVYLGVPLDDEDKPLVPDDIYYFKALTSYVTYMLDYQDWRKGKITDKVYEESKFNWLFYVNSARGAANMPNTAQLEGLKNSMNRLMPLSHYKNGFKNLTKQENINLK